MITFIDRASQAAIGGCEYRWRSYGCGELTMLGDYHLPFAKAEARAEAAKWLRQAA